MSVWSAVARSSLHQGTICGPCWTTSHCWLIQGLQGSGNLLPHLCSFCLFTTNATIVSPIRERGGRDGSSCLLVWLFWWRGSNLKVCYPVPYVNQWLSGSSAGDPVWQQQCVRGVACLGLPAHKAEKELALMMSYSFVILPVCMHTTLRKKPLSGAVIYSIPTISSYYSRMISYPVNLWESLSLPLSHNQHMSLRSIFHNISQIRMTLWQDMWLWFG